MKRAVFILALVWINVIQLALAQSVAMRQGYDLLPQEGIYIHQNSNLLFSGERLYYKIYCLDLETRELSQLSKIAYVALLDKENNAIFRHKIRLESGTGTGDFVIPAEAVTGAYKLIAYTSWMQSRAERPYFEADLVLINPYKVTPEEHQLEPVIDSLISDSIQMPASPKPVIPKAEDLSGENLISLNLDSDLLQTRSAVKIDVNALTSEALSGSYSLSVKRIDENLPGLPSTPLDIWKGFRKAARPGNTEDLSLPELRGELISGQLINRSTSEPAAGRQVVLSLPGDPYILDISQTDDSGTFYFNLDIQTNSELAILQLLGDDKDDFEILMNNNRLPKLAKMEYPGFEFDKSLEPIILARSIHNQIENSYATVKSDTVRVASEDLPFYRNYQQRFLLDDYTRFNTLRETMIEIIDHAWIDENNGDPRFRVRPFDGYLDTGILEPIVTMDGLLIQDHKDIVDYNSKELRRISISRDRFVLGPKVYQGLIALETKTGEFFDVFYRGFLVSSNLERPEAHRSYYFQQHRESDKSGRIPDFRYQLLWEPEVVVNDDTNTITFFTSDITGDFEVELKGYTTTGKHIYLKQQFTVNK